MVGCISKVIKIKKIKKMLKLEQQERQFFILHRINGWINFDMEFCTIQRQPHKTALIKIFQEC